MPAIPSRQDSHDQQPLPPPSAAEEAIIGTVNNNNNDNNNQENSSSNSPPEDQTQQEYQSNSTSNRPHPSHPAQILPNPTLRFQIHDLSHEGVQHFLSAINVSHILQEALDTVCRILYNASTTSSTDTNSPPPTTPKDSSTNIDTDATSETSTAPLPSHPATPPIPPIRSITLILNPMDGVAHTTSIPLDAMHKEIYLSLSYIMHVFSQPAANPTEAIAKLKHELTGVLVHEMVHTVQNNGHGTAPGGLIEGVADWVRLRAGLGAPHWKRPERKDDIAGRWEWDAGYEKTAFFLEWLERREGGKGTVVRMNEWLRERRYEGGEDGDGGFWREVCGESVEGLWREYLEWVEEEGEMAEAIRLSLTGGEE